MKLDLGSSKLVQYSLESTSRSVSKDVLISIMEGQHLITSQSCNLLTGARGITDDDDDPKGSTVQFTWCEYMIRCRTSRKIFHSKAINVNLSPEVRNLPLRHASFKVLKGLFLGQLLG